MKQYFLCTLLFCNLILLPSSAGAQTNSAAWQRLAAKYGWQFDYAKARALARKTGKPMMVVLRCVP